MMENEELKNEALPKAGEEGKPEATTPKEELLIPIKFNKEIRNLTLSEASELAQKGMKYDAVRKDYETLRAMAAKKGRSVTAFLDELIKTERTEELRRLTEKCGGDGELAKHFLELEGNKEPTGRALEELKTFFPDINSTEQLPAAVREGAALSGRELLDEYLRYLFKEQMTVSKAKKQQRSAELSSSGSQANKGNLQSLETAEFLRGLWN